jgi:Flp pilus assembly protein TadG
MLRALSKLIGRDTSGNSAVEFAIVGPVFILILLAIVDFGRLLFVRSSMHYAVEEAGRYAMVYSTADKSTIETYAKTRVYGLDPTALTLTATVNSPSAGYVTITSDYTFNFMFQVMLPSGMGSVPMHAQSIVPRTS